MFRIGKHRKDGITPSDCTSADYATVGPKQIAKSSLSQPSTKLSPPSYQPPPQPPKHHSLHNGDHYRQHQYANYEELQSQIRYAFVLDFFLMVVELVHYINICHTKHIHKNHEFTVFSMFFLCCLPFSDESFNPSSNDVLSESTLECMRQQVMLQRYKVEAER